MLSLKRGELDVRTKLGNFTFQIHDENNCDY